MLLLLLLVVAVVLILLLVLLVMVVVVLLKVFVEVFLLFVGRLGRAEVGGCVKGCDACGVAACKDFFNNYSVSSFLASYCHILRKIICPRGLFYLR